jgi:hypothetical protein
VHRVETSAAAELLIDRGQVRFLAAFLGNERSATGAAAALDVPLHLVLRRIAGFERAGLVHVARVERRHGRPIKHYRTVADEFFVPVALLGIDRFMRSETFWHGLYTDGLTATLLTGLRGLRDGGVRVYRSVEEGVVIEAAEAPGRTWRPPADVAVAFDWSALRLDRATAKALQHDLEALVHTYTRRQDPGGAPYVLGACLAPLDDGRPDARGL